MTDFYEQPISYSLAQALEALRALTASWSAGGLLLYVVAGVYVLWVFFLAVMSLQRARDAGALAPLALTCAYPILAMGWLADFSVNVLVATPLLLDFPRETTVTARLARLIRSQPQGWRGKASRWVCAVFLDTFDPSGKHCR